MRWIRLHWLDEIVLPALVITMRTTWIWPWLVVMSGWFAPFTLQPVVPLWGVVALPVIGRVLVKLGAARKWSLAKARTIVSCTGVVLVVGLLWSLYGRQLAPLWNPFWMRDLVTQIGTGVPGQAAALLTFVIAAGLYLRGVLDGRGTTGHDEIWAGFFWGVVAFALLFVVVRWDAAAALSGIANWLVVFVGSGMAGLALSSVELGQFSGRSTARSRQHLNRYWVASAGVVIAGLLLLGLLLGAIIAPGAVAQALGWVNIVVNVVATVLYWVLAAIAFILIVLLMPLIEWIRSLMADTTPGQPAQVEVFRNPLENLIAATPAAQNPAAFEMLRWAVVVISILLLAVVFLMAVRYFSRQEDDDVDETRESVFSSQIMRNQLAEFLRRLRGSSAHTDYLPLDGEVELRRRVRAVYQAILTRASAAGIPRTPAKTPAEYQADLLAMAPASSEALAIVTAGYERARYAAVAPTQADAVAVEVAWEQISREETPPAKPES